MNELNTGRANLSAIMHSHLSIKDALLEIAEVALIDALRIGQSLGNVHWHGEFIDSQIWIWRNDCSATEVYSLPTQISSKSSRLSLKPLNVTP